MYLIPEATKKTLEEVIDSLDLCSGDGETNDRLDDAVRDLRGVVASLKGD